MGKDVCNKQLNIPGMRNVKNVKMKCFFFLLNYEKIMYIHLENPEPTREKYEHEGRVRDEGTERDVHGRGYSRWLATHLNESFTFREHMSVSSSHIHLHLYCRARARSCSPLYF